MNHRFSKIICSTIIFVLLAGTLNLPVVKADEVVLTVMGNGDSSQNQTTAKVDDTTKVTQSNNAQITNNVTSTATTGNNTASNNTTGTTAVETGNATNNTTVKNQNINTNTAEVTNPNTTITSNTTNNGTTTTNTTNIDVTNTINSTQTNTANIDNQITTNDNTGKNSANENNGNTNISTGNITLVTNVINNNINKNTDPQGASVSIAINVSGNGENSINTAHAVINNTNSSKETNIANIVNNVLNNFNTGENNANKNNGTVTIATGDILAVTNVINDNINSNFYNPSDSQTPVVTPPPGNPGSTPTPGPQLGEGDSQPVTIGSSNSNNSGSSTGQVLGDAIGNILPATGNNLALIGTILAFGLLFAGFGLRLYSGMSPPTIIVKFA